MTDHAIDAPVHKTIDVNASVEHAFHVFTAGFHTWWPKEHHIGKSPMTKAILEPRVGGRCYTEQADGTECDWGSVLVWDPPHRLVLAWQINGQWQFEPDLAKSSEVDVRFSRVGEHATRVDLEHRHLYRHGPAGAAIRMAVDSPAGWNGTLRLFANEAERQKGHAR